VRAQNANYYSAYYNYREREESYEASIGGGKMHRVTRTRHVDPVAGDV
jgi:hypothetical protein